MRVWILALDSLMIMKVDEFSQQNPKYASAHAQTLERITLNGQCGLIQSPTYLIIKEHLKLGANCIPSHLILFSSFYFELHWLSPHAQTNAAANRRIIHAPCWTMCP